MNDFELLAAAMVVVALIELLLKGVL